MIRTPLLTNRRNRSKTAEFRQATGTVPSIQSVAALAGEVNQIQITFNMTVIVEGTPSWNVTVGGSPVAPVSMASHDLTSLVLDYGEDVSAATALTVPADNQSGRSVSGQRIAPGVYPLS